MITTETNREFIEEKYSTFILRNMEDGMLPGNFYRNVTDFIKGETQHIRSIGDSQTQELVEDVAFNFTPIDSGEITLTITDHVGDAWYVTDEAKQDVDMLDQLVQAKSQKSVRALQENFESRALQVLNNGQTDADPNAINGFDHRKVATGNNNTMEVDDILYMKTAFDKAEVPYSGRIAIVDPVVANSLAQKFQGTYNVDSNQTMQEILEGGFNRDHDFVMNIFGWNIMTSNRLPKGSFGDGTSTVSDGVANIFLSVLDDQTKPLMAAWRQMPTTESSRNHGLRRDEFSISSRFGMAVQRADSLGTIITSATNLS